MKKGKRILCLLLAVCLMAACLPLSASAAGTASFTEDVTDKAAWYYKAVYYCKDKGYMDGTSATSFEPSGTVQRSMVAQVLYKKSGAPSVDVSANPFTDVEHGKWYENAVVWGQQNGVVTGMGDTAFKPDGFVTREQVCTMFYRYYTEILGKTPELATEDEMAKYTDRGDVSGWAEDSVRWAIKSGFMTGTSETALSPRKTANRGQLAQFLMNFDGKVLGMSDVDSYVPPEPPPKPVETFKAPTKISTTAAGVSVTGVSFNPSNGYSAQVALANNKFFSNKAAGSIVSDTGAYVAVNGAVFNCYEGQDLDTHSNIISGGVVKRIYSDGGASFVVDTEGKASIETFEVKQTVTILRDGEEVSKRENTGLNKKLGDNDGTVMVYNSTYGKSTVPVPIACGVVADSSGKVTKIYPFKGGSNSYSNVAIPSNGFIVVEPTWWNQWGSTNLSKCQEGDTVELSYKYEGSSKQNISTALSSGPTLVKNGTALSGDTIANQANFTSVKQGALNRMAIGVKADGTVVIVNATADLGSLAKAMAALGCKDAINLDGGGSTNLYSKNIGWLVGPTSRKMSNMIVFTKK